jgi:hypothetical protein
MVTIDNNGLVSAREQYLDYYVAILEIILPI